MVTTAEQAHRLPPSPGTPSPTDNGRMSTMAKAEDQHRPTDLSTEKKLRHVRVQQGLWVAACEKAESEGVTISEVVRRLLADYVA